MRKNSLPHSHSGGFSIDSYAYSSGMRKWNPTLKVFFSLAVLFCCILADLPWVSAATLVLCTILTLFKGRLSPKRYAALMMTPAAFVILGTGAIAINFSKAPAGDFSFDFHWFYVYFTKEGLRTVGFLILKVFGAVSALFLMTLSTPSHELLTVLRKARCPKLIVELMNMIYRFIFILLEVQSRMRISAQARLGFRDFRTGCFSFGKIACNLLFLSLRKANAYYDAMESRCYTGELLFLEDERKVGAEQLLWSCGGLLFLFAVWRMTI